MKKRVILKGNDEKLREGVKTLQYEIRHLHYAFRMIFKAKDDIYLKNIFIESFLIHWRNLIDFLYKSSKNKDDDILSIDYVNDVKRWEEKRGKKTRYLIEEHNDVNKYLAHITYKRIEALKQWEFSQMLEELIRKFRMFVEHVSEERKKWFDLTSLEELKIRDFEIVDGTYSN